jgi:zinc transport system substrate-binding protein
MVKRHRRVVAASLAFGTLLGACGSSGREHAQKNGRMPVVASFFPIAEAARQVGGDAVTVDNLTPAGAEPHDLELTPDQVDDIEDARAVFVLGHHFQPAVEAGASQHSERNVELLDQLTTKVKNDPHVWLDPVLYAQLVDAIARDLAKIDPSRASEYEANAARYKIDIERVGREYRQGLADCDRRTFVTAHEAFGYLARRYDLFQEAVAGLAPDQEPNAKRLGKLADLVKRDGVTTIFTEELVSPKVSDALAREAGGVETETLNPLEGLTEREQRRGGDWASVMLTNLKKLTAALGCTATG